MNETRTEAPCAALLLADGFEEIEAITVADVLRRAGIETTLVGVAGTGVRGAHDIEVTADCTLEDAPHRAWGAVVLPGGMPGAARLRDDERVRSLVTEQHARGGIVAAICAAPIVVAAAGLLEGRRATCYPTFRDQLAGAQYVEAAVVEDGAIVTSRGPATALAFALALVARLAGSDVRDELASRMLVDRLAPSGPTVPTGAGGPA